MKNFTLILLLCNTFSVYTQVCYTYKNENPQMKGMNVFYFQNPPNEPLPNYYSNPSCVSNLTLTSDQMALILSSYNHFYNNCDTFLINEPELKGFWNISNKDFAKEQSQILMSAVLQSVIKESKFASRYCSSSIFEKNESELKDGKYKFFYSEHLEELLSKIDFQISPFSNLTFFGLPSELQNKHLTIFELGRYREGRRAALVTKSLDHIPKEVGIKISDDIWKQETINKNGDTSEINWVKEIYEHALSYHESWVITNEHKFFMPIDFVYPVSNENLNHTVVYLTPDKWNYKNLETIISDQSYAIPFNVISEYQPFMNQLKTMVQQESWVAYNSGYSATSYLELKKYDSLCRSGQITPVEETVNGNPGWMYIKNFRESNDRNDENGNVITENLSQQYIPLKFSEIMALEFLVDWKQDKKTKAMVKEVKGFTIFIKSSRGDYLVPAVYFLKK